MRRDHHNNRNSYRLIGKTVIISVMLSLFSCMQTFDSLYIEDNSSDNTPTNDLSNNKFETQAIKSDEESTNQNKTDSYAIVPVKDRYQPKQVPKEIPKEEPVFIVNTELLAKGFHFSGASTAQIIESPALIKEITNKDLAPNDIWTRIRNGFKIDTTINSRVLSELRYYSKHKSYINRVSVRGKRYMYHILEEAEKRDIPTEIALLPVVESAFQPFAYSHGRASGIWQFIPATGKRYGLKQNWWYDGRRDIVASTDAAFDYLQYLAKLFDGDWLLALAAYNSGEGTVKRAIRRNKKKGKPTDYWSLSLPRETESYVPKLMAFTMIVANPEKYDVTLIDIPNKKYFDVVDIKSQLDLSLAADLAEIPLKELYRLNPGFNRWATPPNGPHRLAIPSSKTEKFSKALSELPNNKRIKWVRHKIRSGEALLTIAKKYNTTTSLIKKANNLRGNMIRAGKYLVIPVSLKSEQAYALSSSQRKISSSSRSQTGRKITHTVRKGDTLWDISRKYKVSVRKLAKWNSMAPGDNLSLGQKLVVWTKSKTASASSSLPEGIMKTVTYTVRKGDSLARIAKKFNVSVADIKSWNYSVRRSKYIQPGQRIKIKVNITAQS